MVQLLGIAAVGQEVGNRTMRVALVSDSYAPQVNGVAISVRLLARSLAEAGHSVAVYTVYSRSSAGDGEPDAYPVVRRPAVPLPLNDAFCVAAPLDRAALRFVERFQPDVMHCHSPFGVGWQGLRAGLACGIPILGTHHTLFAQYVECYSPFGRWTNRRVAAMLRRYVAAFYNRCDLVTCASRFLALDVMRGGMARPITVIPNAVDTQRFSRQPRHVRDGDAQCIVFCGRLAPEKNLFGLLDLLEPALRGQHALSLRIVGDGPLRAALEHEIVRRGLAGKITLTGWLHGEELAAEIANADLSVSASITENQSLALLESLAAGVPVVALAAAGAPEVVRHGVNGYLLDPGAAASTFAQTVESLLAAPDQRAEMGRQARLFAEQHALEAHRTRVVDAYAETIARAQWRLQQKSPIPGEGRGTNGLRLRVRRSLPRRY